MKYPEMNFKNSSPWWVILKFGLKINFTYRHSLTVGVCLYYALKATGGGGGLQ
jgi:hypothetical protein